MEGIKFQNEEFDRGVRYSGGRKKNLKKRFPLGWLPPPHFFGINCISEKKLRKQYYICVYSFSSDFRVGVRVFRGARTPLGGRNQTVAEGVGGPGLSRGADVGTTSTASPLAGSVRRRSLRKTVQELGVKSQGLKIIKNSNFFLK